MVVSACPERSGEPVEPRSRGVLSPCPQCGHILPGVQCGLHNRARCARFLDYIQRLHRIREHHLLINELRQLISK